MRCVIARFPFELTKGGVLETMKGVKPEQVTGDSVIIGRRHYPPSRSARSSPARTAVTSAAARSSVPWPGSASPAAPSPRLRP
ncbi:hypothetical protein STENM327S_07124 [Streptomyces tendae]